MRRVSKHIIITLMSIIWLLCGSYCVAHPDTPSSLSLWKNWQAHDENSPSTVDHSVWQNFLNKYVVENQRGVNRIRYANVSAKDRNYLYDYIWSLSKIDINTYSRKQQLAYWINLYNALIVKVILDHYPIESINDIDISPGFFTQGPWDAELIRINHISLSLNDIKLRIIRPIWDDPRILYALNGGSLGYPDISKKVYLADTLESQLNTAAENFINCPRGIRIIKGRLVASLFYQSFISDFGGSEQLVLEHLRKYAKPELKEKLLSINHISRNSYNWHLNDSLDSYRPSKTAESTPSSP